jgi:hypothetical protein
MECVWRRSRGIVLSCISLLVILASEIRAAEPVAMGSTVQVVIDQAKLLKLPEGTATLVVGNPLIADVSLQTGGVIVLTGKSYGTTNVVALDRAGTVTMEHLVEVQGPRENVLVLYRGIDRESYSCTPKCERRITIGDTQNYFAGSLGQTGAFNAQAQNAQPQQPK